jgi:hypothetical protein
MKKELFTILPFGIMMASIAYSEERIELNNVYPINQEQFELSDRNYIFLDNQGYYEVVDGPLQNGSARCLGAGEWFQDGTNSVNGICIFGEGEDTFIKRWRAGEQGSANTWFIAAGTGKFEGMTGEGIATTGVEIMYKSMPMRQTHIVGTIDFPSD